MQSLCLLPASPAGPPPAGYLGPVLAKLCAALQWTMHGPPPPLSLLLSLRGGGCEWTLAELLLCQPLTSLTSPSPVKSPGSRLRLTKEETEAQRGQVTCPRPCSKSGMESEPTESGLSDAEGHICPAPRRRPCCPRPASVSSLLPILPTACSLCPSPLHPVASPHRPWVSRGCPCPGKGPQMAVACLCF